MPAWRSSNGVVLVAWASHEDMPPYHGWIMGFDATTLARVGAFAVTPDVYGGGVWQGGRAPTIDAAGNAYFATGNGKWDGTRNFGDSLLKFARRAAAGLTLLDYFTPGNEAMLQCRRRRPERIGFHPAARHEPAARRRQGRRALSPRRRQPGTQGRQRHADRPEDPGQRWARDGRAGLLEFAERRTARLQLVGRRRARGVSA